MHTFCRVCQPAYAGRISCQSAARRWLVILSLLSMCSDRMLMASWTDVLHTPFAAVLWMHPTLMSEILSHKCILRAVLQVFCVHSEPNYSLPWQRKRQFSSTGSGFLLPDRRILTNAHCVDHHSQVRCHLLQL